MNDNGRYKMWYSGLNSSNWAIGLATSEALPPAPTPSPSPSPTPSPSPSPTPTPTPIPKKKIVVIPGLGASWNADLMFNCRASDGGDTWVMNDIAKKFYNGLMNRLEENGLNVLPFYYDWRRTPTQNAAQLSELIHTQVTQGEKFDVVGHSMGGLVARAYAEQTQDESGIDAFLAVGSPFGGSALAYPVWEGGQIANDNVLIRFALEAVVHFCALTQGVSKIQAIRGYAPSVKQLLPVADYLQQSTTYLLTPESGMVHRNEWLPNTYFAPPYYGIRVGTLNGTGFRTLVRLRVKTATKKQKSAGLWDDGAVVTKIYNTLGDGTVLRTSAQLPEADNRILKLNHGGLVQNKKGVDAIMNFFGYTDPSSSMRMMAQEEPSEPEVLSALVLMAYPGSFEVTNPDGSVLRDNNGMVAIANPKSGTRRIRLYPAAQETRFVVAQILKNGTNLWKEYKIKGTAPKIKNIIFDEIRPLEDPMR